MRGKKRPIICTDTGRVFSNNTAASIALGIPASSISKCLSGEYKRAGGLRWEYAHPEKPDPPKPPKPPQKDTRRMTIYEVQEEAERRTKETGRFVRYADIQKEETLQMIKEVGLCPIKKHKRKRH